MMPALGAHYCFPLFIYCPSLFLSFSARERQAYDPSLLSKGPSNASCSTDTTDTPTTKTRGYVKRSPLLRAMAYCSLINCTSTRPCAQVSSVECNTCLKYNCNAYILRRQLVTAQHYHVFRKTLDILISQFCCDHEFRLLSILYTA